MNPFKIKDCALIALASGSRAQNLREFSDNLMRVPADCIYYHFWGRLLRPRFDDPEYVNDFAAWAFYGVSDAVLAERLALVDPTTFDDLEELRSTIVEIVEERLDEREWLAWSPATRSFHFIQSKIVVFKTNLSVKSPGEFAELLPALSLGSVFYHFIDARRRNSDGMDDFREWMRDCGEEYAQVCHDLARIDPYFQGLSRLRGRLTEIFLRIREGVSS